MLVDIVVRNHENGGVLPAISWHGHEGYSWAQRLENRTFGRLKRGALKEAFRIVRDNGGLDISGNMAASR